MHEVVKILFVDDDESATNALIRVLQKRDSSFAYLSAQSADEALSAVERHHPAVVVIDLSLDESAGPVSGLELLSELVGLDSTMRLIVLTGHGDEQFGLSSIQRGAASFLKKPIDPDQLLTLLRDATAHSVLRRRFERLQRDTLAYTFSKFSSHSPAMAKIFPELQHAAESDLPVLLLGETGTGKSVLAAAIHSASKRAKGPFIRCFPRFGSPDLASSELFGHQRGAFTGAHDSRIGLIEEANGGTLFIDELDELPMDTQITLLNVLQERCFRRLGSNRELHSNFRLLCASNHPLSELQRGGKLRRDLFHRVAHVVIEIPKLKERAEDIEPLAEDFLRELIVKEKLSVQGFSSAARERLKSYSWPGNVRELQGVVESAAFRARMRQHRFIEPEDLGIQRSRKVASSLTFRERVHEFESRLILETLERCGNNQSLAARELGIDRTSLRRIVDRAEKELKEGHRPNQALRISNSRS